MKPRVLFVTASYPTPDAPTSGIFVREHARAAALHADVVVVHLNRTSTRRVQVEQVSEEVLPTWRIDYPRRPLGLSYVGNVVATAMGYRAVRRSGFRPQLIHANFFIAAVPALLVGAVTRKPVVTTEHWSVFLPSDPMQLGPLNRALARFAFRRSTMVLPVSAALRDAIAGLGVDTPFRVVPNAVDTDLFHPPAAAQATDGRLLAVSGLYGAKGFEYLLPALARVSAHIHLDVVGDGEGRGRYERLASELGIESRVRFHGERPKAEVAEHMRRADLYVLASIYENNPSAVLEALVSGLPVVATRVGGVPEVVTEERGELAEPKDVAGLATKIEQALAREFDRGAIADGAAREFGLDVIGRSLADVYSEVLQRC